MRAMHDAVQDGVRQGRLVQPNMPGRYRQLAGHERGAAAHPVIEQLQQIIALVRGNGSDGRSDGKVVEYEQVQPGKLSEPARKAAIAMGHMPFSRAALSRRSRHLPLRQSTSRSTSRAREGSIAQDAALNVTERADVLS